MQEYEKLKRLIEGCAHDMDKCNRGNKAAGTRVRKVMQEIKAQVQLVRKAILTVKGS